MENMCVWVTFEVEYHQPSAEHVPRLIGSLEELGVWKHEHSIKAKQTEVDFKWRITMKLPTKSNFFFNWIVKTNEGQFTVEETGCRKADVGKFGGTFFTIYGNTPFTFVSNCGCKVEVTTNYILNFTEEIGLVGSGDWLGNWKEENVVRAVKYAPDLWAVNLELAHFFLLEYKWVIVDKNSKKIIRWQEGENRKIKIRNGWKQVKLNSPWIGDVAVNVLDKTLDTFIDVYETTDSAVEILPPAWKSSGVVIPSKVVSPSNIIRVTSPSTSKTEVIPPFMRDKISIERKPGVPKKFSVNIFFSNFKRITERKMWPIFFNLVNSVYNQWRFNQ